ncbi:phosphopeptide-binding protein [Planomonospora sphaerica]|uniref:Phosphopeptide-binding protein n=1 Tax=Planomonospora sphaerica TaxID=161355 RepID=A0A171B592_9ACTN|nr:FHA domain-containing protein [Planomonospora sphaerica]GAT64670.1 phosphopeptide-binding protein [Planomonospora sphaerica]
MADCPRGHDPGEAGLADGYCGVCGSRLTGVPGAGGASPSSPSSPPAPAAAGSPGGCAACGAPVSGRFCEDCGHDQAAAPRRAVAVAVAVEWRATVEADRAHYDEMIAQGGPDAARVLFPPYCPRRNVPLTGTEVRIGRLSRSRALAPEIDLSGPPEDPGVSHLHAVLLSGPGDTWTLVDPGSANGTIVNGRPVEANRPVPVDDGARIHLGAWTLITLRRGRSA